MTTSVSGVPVGVWVGRGDAVALGVTVGVADALCVGLLEAVAVGVPVGVRLGSDDAVGASGSRCSRSSLRELLWRWP